MKNRNPLAALLLSIVTFGIYGIVWQVKTKGEMNKLGANIPTAWLLIVPLVNLYWLWTYSKGVEKVTNGAYSGAVAFLLLFFLGIIGMAIIQAEFNKLAAGATPAAAPAPAPAADAAGQVAPSTPADAVSPNVSSDEQTPPPAAPVV